MKNKSMKNKIFASALALTLTIGAFQLPSYVANAAEPNAPQLRIKKVLNLPESGVSTPDETFTFQFEAHSFNREEQKKDKLPTINEAKAEIKQNMNTDMDTVNKGKQIIKLTDDVLKDVKFTEVGQYTYKVKEKVENKEGMTYSKASYLVSIRTKTGDKGTVVIDNIQIKQEKADNGTDIQNPTKTPYKPGTEDDKGEGNNFVFNNNYDPKNGNDNPTGTDIDEKDKKGFVLRKEVAGTDVNANEKFTFSITANKPEGSHSTETTFKYKVLSNGTAVEKTGKYGEAFSVELKHTDRVVFSGVLLGSIVKAEETVDKGYTKSIKQGSKINGQDVTSVETLKNGLAIGDAQSGNFVNFVNTQQTPTGILMNHLPFIALVLAAVSGILFFVKNKKEDEKA